MPPACSNRSVLLPSASASPAHRLHVIHTITRKAIDEDRARRHTLLELRDSHSDDLDVLSSIRYRDLLELNLSIFNHSSEALDTEDPHKNQIFTPSEAASEAPSSPDTHSLSPDVHSPLRLRTNVGT